METMTLADRIYRAVTCRDMTRWELVKLTGESIQNVIHGITSATYKYPDIYSYWKKRGKKQVVEYVGILGNYERGGLDG